MHTPGGVSKRQFIGLSSVLLLTTLAIYWRALYFDFVLDDLFHIVNDERILSLTAATRFFVEPIYPGDLYRPLPGFSYAVTHLAFGLDPFPYHLVNILWHSVNCVLVMWALSYIIGLKSAGWMALIFAVHPIHTEAVGNIAGRSELSAATFVLLALLLIRKKTAPKRSGTILNSLCGAVGIALLFLLALLCKESAVVLVLLAPLYIVWRSKVLGVRAHGTQTVTVGLLISLLFYAWLRTNALGPPSFERDPQEAIDNPLILLGGLERVVAALQLLGRYIRLILFPLPLSADYSFGHLIPLTLTIESVCDVVLISLLLGSCFYGARRVSVFSLMSLWFFLAFAVTSNILFPIGTIFGERLAYLPSIGVIGIMVMEVHSIKRSWIQDAILGAATLLLAGVTTTHLPVWKSNQSLHTYQLSVSPRSAKTQMQYAVVLRNQGSYDGARAHLDRALKIYPEFPAAAFAYATVEHKAGNDRGAEQWLRKALGWRPDHLPSLKMLASLLEHRGEIEEARRINEIFMTYGGKRNR